MQIEGDEDELLLTDEVPDEDDQQQVAESQHEADPEPLELEIEGEEAGDDTPLIKQLRQQVADAKREAADLRRASQPGQKIEVGKRPTIEDFDWDQEKFDAAYDAWNDRRLQAERHDREATEQQEVKNREFERLRDNHRQRALMLRIPDFDAREKAVVDALGSPELAGIALVLANDSAKLVGAVGANSAALARIEAEPDPIRKLKILKELESKIVTRKAPPPPEAQTIQRGTASVAQPDPDKKLAQLEKEAERTGDRTKIIAHKREMKLKNQRKAA